MKLPLLCLLASVFCLSSCETVPQPASVQGTAIGSIQRPPYGRTITLQETIVIDNATLDGSLPGGKVTRYLAGPKLGDGSQSEGQKPLFILRGNATLKNIRLEGADGVHVEVTGNQRASILNCGWDNVGEDAITLMKGSTGRLLVKDCYFLHAEDKILQCNATGEVVMENCQAEDFGKLARGCGTCGDIAYDITVKRPVAKDGYAVLMLTNPKGKGRIIGGKFQDVKHIALAQNGAKIDLTLTPSSSAND